jgi:YegS/Rv2252/BmrU family lipid kinase
MTWWAVVNPTAGGRQDPEDRVRAALDARDIPAVLHVSESGEHVGELVAEGVGHGHERFLAVGGDGTAGLVAHALLEHPWEQPPILGILPAGTGCDFVRTFGFAQTLEDAVRHLEGDETYPVDVGVARGSWGERRFLNALDTGVIGATVKTAERATRRLGRLRYQAAFVLQAPFFRSSRMTLELDDRTVEVQGTTVVVANGQFFGFGINVAPRASLLDGLFEVMILEAGPLRTLTLLPVVKRGEHLKHPAVQRYSTASVRLETDRPWPIEIDGDYLGETPVEVRMLPGALRLKI